MEHRLAKSKPHNPKPKSTQRAGGLPTPRAHLHPLENPAAQNPIPQAPASPVTAPPSTSPSSSIPPSHPLPSTEADHNWVVLAHLLRPQGRKGEILAELLTDSPDLFETNENIFLAPPNFTGPSTAARPAEILSFFLPVGRNEGRIVLHLDGVDSIEAAETLTGLELILSHADLPALEDDANYIGDLLDCAVYTQTSEAEGLIGTIADVQFALTPDGNRRLEDAAPILEVTGPNGEEYLIPYAKHFLISLDVPAKKIVMRLPEGLLEINQ